MADIVKGWMYYDQSWRGAWFGGLTNWVPSDLLSWGPSGGSFGPNRLYAIPFQVNTGASVADIAAYFINLATSCTVRLGMYAAVSSANPYPGALVFQTGDAKLASGTSGVVICSVSPTQVVSTNGLFWLAFITSSTGAVACYRGGVGIGVSLGTNATNGWTISNLYVSSWGYGSLPSSFPNSWTVDGNPSPKVAVRLV